MSNYPIWQKYAYDKEPDIELLKKALEDERFLINNTETRLKALRLKYQAMTTVPTVIEKTMTPEQLYDTQNPLWAREYTVQELVSYVTYSLPTTSYKKVKKLIQMDSMETNAIKLIKNTEYGATERK